MVAYDLWGDPIPPPEPKQPKPKYRKRQYPQQVRNRLPTDILEWLRENQPETSDELMDLRRALYTSQTHGKYEISDQGYTQAGEEKFTVRGSAGLVLIVSNKARHFLLRNLCRLRQAKGWPPIAY
jgi:hypothetical protein